MTIRLKKIKKAITIATIGFLLSTSTQQHANAAVYKNLSKAKVTTALKITKGNSKTIAVQKVPTKTKKSFVSLDKKIASVSSKGVVKAKKAGKTTIKITLIYNKKKVVKKCKIVVKNSTTSTVTNKPDVTSAPTSAPVNTSTIQPTTTATVEPMSTSGVDAVTPAPTQGQEPLTTPEQVSTSPAISASPVNSPSPVPTVEGTKSDSCEFAYSAEMSGVGCTAYYTDDTYASYSVSLSEVKAYYLGETSQVTYTYRKYDKDNTLILSESKVAGISRPGFTSAEMTMGDVVLTLSVTDIFAKKGVLSVQTDSPYIKRVSL